MNLGGREHALGQRRSFHLAVCGGKQKVGFDIKIHNLERSPGTQYTRATASTSRATDPFQLNCLRSNNTSRHLMNQLIPGLSLCGGDPWGKHCLDGPHWALSLTRIWISGRPQDKVIILKYSPPPDFPSSQSKFSPGLTVWPLGVFNFIPHAHLHFFLNMGHPYHKTLFSLIHFCCLS